MFPRLRSFLKTLTQRERFEDSLDEEVRFHLDVQTEDLVRTGVPPEEAARRAREHFGSIEAMKDDCRRVRGLRITDELGAWLNIPLWALRSAPGNGNQEETTYGEHRGPRDGAIPRGPGRL